MMRHLMTDCLWALLIVLLLGSSLNCPACQAMTVRYFGLRAEPPMHNTVAAFVCLLDRSEQLPQVLNADLKTQWARHQMSDSDISSRYKNQFKVLSHRDLVVLCLWPPH